MRMASRGSAPASRKALPTLAMHSSSSALQASSADLIAWGMLGFAFPVQLRIAPSGSATKDWGKPAVFMQSPSLARSGFTVLAIFAPFQVDWYHLFLICGSMSSSPDHG